MIGIAQYRKNAVAIASPQQLVMMLYETSLRRLASAEARMRAGDRGWIDDLHRVREILIELAAALDDEAAPELCARLRPLYAWMHEWLVAAGSGPDPSRVAAVRDALVPIAEAWRATLSLPEPLAKVS